MKKFLLLCLMTIIFHNCESTNYPSSRSNSTANPNISSSTSDFGALMVKDKIDKNQRSAAVVSQLINDSPTDKVAAIVIENTTNCNIIVRISGAKNYLLPIYKNDKNFLIIDKGNYTFSSNFCRAKYYTQKSISESLTITLSEK